MFIVVIILAVVALLLVIPIVSRLYTPPDTINSRRLIIFIVCTLLSGVGLYLSGIVVFSLFSNEFRSGNQIVIPLLILVSWSMYFGVSTFWIRSMRPPRYMVIIGLVSSICIFFSFGLFAIIFTLPSIILVVFMCDFIGNQYGC